MYPNTKTWNPAVGCNFDCLYCEPSFKRQLKRVARNIGCHDCYDYVPHYHPERLNKIPSAPIIFVFGTGEIYFYDSSYVRKTFSAIDNHKPRMKKIYYFQSKNPVCFNQYLDWFKENQDKVILLTTLETNKRYTGITKAPPPDIRFKDFYDLDYSRKVVTIEPVMDFNFETFLMWMLLLRNQGTLEYVWYGYDSKNCGLPEPSIIKSQLFVNTLIKKGIEVRGKSLRGVTIRSLEESVDEEM